MTADGAGHPGRPPKVYHAGRWRRVGNVATSGLVRLGLLPHSYLLTTVGRKSGQARRNPVTIVEDGGRRWLVAPYGAVSWVHNARAAGKVSLTRGRTTQEFVLREANAAEAGPVLKRYVAIARVTRPYFAADHDDPPETFAAEAAAHPVFELLPAAHEDPAAPPEARP